MSKRMFYKFLNERTKSVKSICQKATWQNFRKTGSVSELSDQSRDTGANWLKTAEQLSVDEPARPPLSINLTFN